MSYQIVRGAVRTWVVGQGTLFSSKCSREMHVCVILSVFNPKMSILGILRFTFFVSICFFAFFGKTFMYFNAGKVLQYFFMEPFFRAAAVMQPAAQPAAAAASGGGYWSCVGGVGGRWRTGMVLRFHLAGSGGWGCTM